MKTKLVVWSKDFDFGLLGLIHSGQLPGPWMSVKRLQADPFSSTGPASTPNAIKCRPIYRHHACMHHHRCCPARSLTLYHACMVGSSALMLAFTLDQEISLVSCNMGRIVIVAHYSTSSGRIGKTSSLLP